MQKEIKQLMAQTGVAFGTSGARGLACEMTDLVCYAYTKGFLQYLESVGELTEPGTEVAIAGDFRPSTGCIMAAVALYGINDRTIPACELVLKSEI